MAGYDQDWTNWDKFIRNKFHTQLSKLAAFKYENLEIFKSPKGRWMAFYNEHYTDIKIIDLKTLDVIATDFYSSKVYENNQYSPEKSFYMDHVNFSTFVPSYKSIYKKSFNFVETYESLNNTDFEDVNLDKITSMPIAFNAWTIWGADYDYIVDVLDLREIDKGIIKKWDKALSFVIPIEAPNVRDYIKVDLDYYYDVKLKEGDDKVYVPTGTNSAQRGEFMIKFKILEERSKDQMIIDVNTGNLSIKNVFSNTVYKPNKNVPWVMLNNRLKKIKNINIRR